ncbi:MAG: cache domain-containing protein, partial [Syntrophothermus sp.]
MILRLKSLKNKMLFYFLGSTSILLISLTAVVMNVVGSEIRTGSYNTGLEKARNIAAEINGQFGSNIQIVKNTNSIVEMYKTRSRKELHDINKNFALSNPQFTGVYITFEPGLYDGKDKEYIGNQEFAGSETGKFSSYWHFVNGVLTQNSLTDSMDNLAGDASAYYQVPKKTLKPYIAEPYVDNNVMMYSIVFPIMIEGVFNGITGADVAINSVNEQLSKVTFMQSGFVEMISAAGMYVATPKKELLGAKTIYDVSKTD